MQLLDQEGRWRAGEDPEAQQGLTHTVDWIPDAEVVQRQGVPVPRELPASEYTIITGLYGQDNGQRLPLLPLPGTDGPPDYVVLGTVTVTVLPPAVPPQPVHRTPVEFSLGGEPVRLLGYNGPQDRWQPNRRRNVETATGVVTLTFRRPFLDLKADPHVRLFWQAGAALTVDARVAVRVVAPDSATIVSHEGPPQQGLHPTPRWRPGEVVLDERPRRPEAPVPAGRYALQVRVFQEDAGGGRTSAPAPGAAEDGWVTIDHLTVVTPEAGPGTDQPEVPAP